MDPLPEFHSSNKGGNHLMVIPMDLVRFLTKDSGFLRISSTERDRELDFNSASFISPAVDWTPPYPYCPDDVLFPTGDQAMNESYQFPFEVISAGTSFKKKVFANDSLGG